MLNLSSKFQRQVEIKKRRSDWWLFHATDFQSLMYPCFFFCRILGIFPYKINGSSFENSKPCYLLSTIVMCIFTSCALIIITDIPGWFQVSTVSKMIELHFVYIFGSFLTIVTYVLSGPQKQLLHTILKNSLILPSKTYRKHSMLIHAKDIFGFFILFGHLLIIIISAIHMSLWAKLSLMYNILVKFVMNMLYINCVYVLKACFKKINDDLKNLLVTNDKHLVKWICRKQSNPLLLMELNALKKRHLTISASVQMLNIIYSPQLLASLVIIFIRITFEIYSNVVHWQNGYVVWSSENIQINVVIYLWAYFILKILLMAWVCETGKNEAIKISTTVHDAINRTSDEQIKYEVPKS
ncbi:PREDICTED: uncharacterized protein LOC105568951 [Vollenhovia emeryi]|uniref:uncharacterized protein LOC105568951 n=1 Tax=Vollenhovia emeryi TaxID=411798 RepID=UPI0005F3CF93|nr:PREDICTED: uncharacterized protein LOC105568951 [Vollenhovia emeryi]